MWRALVYLGLLAIAAFGAVWLADRPGTVVMTWGGYETRTTVAVAAVVLIGIALLLSLLWSIVRFFLDLPNRIGFASRARRRGRGYEAVSRGMVAVGAGDPLAARRYANEAERYLGHEPLTLLLKAQAAQISGDRGAAETAFRRMMEEPGTRILGLRGLFVEARRRGDLESARDHAAEAARLAPSVTWANDAILEAECAEGDWRGAIANVERRASLGLVDKTTARRHRAVLLTADAQARMERDPDGALASATEAVKLAPDLVPAAAIAGRLLSRRGDLRRAARVVEAAWRTTPHPELAEVYLNLRPGDSALDRLKRAETLAKWSSWDPEARLAVAGAALEAREFVKARRTLEPLLEDRPTMRACLLMADIEQAEHGATGKTREWLARAARAPRDPVWIADGIVSDHWAPVAPTTGRLDAFVWQAPPDVLAAPESKILDEMIADLAEQETAALAAPPAIPPAPAEPSAPTAPAVPVAPTAPVVPAEPAVVEVRPIEPQATGTQVYEARSADTAPTDAQKPVPSEPSGVVITPAGPLPDGPARPDAKDAETKPAAVVFPVDHAPDDPGPDKEADPKPRFRLFG